MCIGAAATGGGVVEIPTTLVVLIKLEVLVLVLVGVHAFNRNSGIHTAGSEPAL